MPPVKRAIIILDQTSGALRQDGARTLGIDLHPATIAACSACGAAGVEALVAVPGAGTDAFAGLAAPGIGIVGIPPIAYADGDALARLAPADQPTALVSADRRLRGEAQAVGLHPAPHPALLPLMADGGGFQAARIAGPKATLERFAVGAAVVPMQFQPSPAADGWALFGLFGPAGLVDAALAGLTVMPLAYDPATDDLVWARIDEAGPEARDALAGRRILYAEPGQVLIALAPGEDAQALQMHGAHGHAEFLAPDPGLLRTPFRGDDIDPTDLPDLPDGGSSILEPVISDEVARDRIRLFRPKCAQVTAGYTADLDRYSGVTPLDAAGAIVSRHSAHPDNKRAEAQLLADLAAMGYCPWRHDFVHAGATHSNIIADLPGSGRFRVRPTVLERLRHILAEPVLSRAVLPAEVTDLMADAFDGPSAEDLPDAELRRELERILVLRPWYPWWKLRCPMPGIGAGLVIVGGHMDSTAASDLGYSPTSDPAPGRDDNGSGLAAVLSIARHFRSLAGMFTHTVRFCFFNAEESGLVGSKAFAAHLKAQNAPVRGVFCTDMIGYNSDANRLFEVHAGYTDPAVRDLSDPLAARVAAAAAEYGALAPAQIYRGTGYTGSPDRDIFDGAINRSDHAAFQQQGWGAVLASEDFFANLATEPTDDPNPNYHHGTDQATDTAYARDITCAVARAATLLAL